MRIGSPSNWNHLLWNTVLAEATGSHQVLRFCGSFWTPQGPEVLAGAVDHVGIELPDDIFCMWWVLRIVDNGCFHHLNLFIGCVGFWGSSVRSTVSTSDNVLNLQVTTHGHTCRLATEQSVLAPSQLAHGVNLSPSLPRELIEFQNLLTLHSFTTSQETSCLASSLIVLLLPLSGHVQPKPGSELQCIWSPLDFNPYLVSQYFISTCVVCHPRRTCSEFVSTRHIVVISGTWLTKTIADVSGYNVHCTSRPKTGGRAATFVKSKFHSQMVLSESISFCITVVGVL